MGKLKLVITFHGGKADEHRLSTDVLERVFSAISSDIENVYRVVSHADIEITSEDIKRDTKLYLAAKPAGNSFELHFCSDETPSDWIEVAGKKYAGGLRLVGSGAIDLPQGIGKSVLEHAKLFANPARNEYEYMELVVEQKSEPDIEVVFDDRFGIAVERQLVDLKVVPPEIHGYEIEGILHALDDQDYTKPTGSVLVKVASHDGDWYCEINKGELPMHDLNDIWKKRIFARGFATFRPRKRTLRVDSFVILPDKPSLLDAVDKFISVNQEMWEGQDPTEYLDAVREKNSE